MLARQSLIGEIRDDLAPDLRSFPVGNASSRISAIVAPGSAVLHDFF